MIGRLSLECFFMSHTRSHIPLNAPVACTGVFQGTGAMISGTVGGSMSFVSDMSEAIKCVVEYSWHVTVLPVQKATTWRSAFQLQSTVTFCNPLLVSPFIPPPPLSPQGDDGAWVKPRAHPTPALYWTGSHHHPL